jgi:hypothetical protein
LSQLAVEARSKETKQLIRDIKCITRRKFTAGKKTRIVLERFRRHTPNYVAYIEQFPVLLSHTSQQKLDGVCLVAQKEVS